MAPAFQTAPAAAPSMNFADMDVDFDLQMMSDDDDLDLAMLVPTLEDHQPTAPDAAEAEEVDDDDDDDDEPAKVPVMRHSKPSSRHVATFQMPAATVKVSREQAAINRAERVALYRAKRKNRKFEKTIRYASRKAYAEVRPRIKGRFAKPHEMEAMRAAAAAAAQLTDEDLLVVPCM